MELLVCGWLEAFENPLLKGSVASTRRWFPLHRSTKEPGSFLAAVEPLAKAHAPDAEFCDALLDATRRRVFFPGQRLAFQSQPGTGVSEELFIGAIKKASNAHSLLSWSSGGADGRSCHWPEVGELADFPLGQAARPLD